MKRPSIDPVHKRILELERLHEVASDGMTFEDEVALIREHNGLRQLLADGKPVPGARARGLEKRVAAARLASEAAAKQVRTMRNECAILQTDGARRIDAALGRYTEHHGIAGYLALQEAESVRCWYFDFLGGSATPEVNAPLVEGVTDGYVGWRNVPRILNSGTDQTTTSLLWLNWFRAVPRDGSFSYRLAASHARLKLRYKLWGNGLWGTDARLNVKIFTWVSVGQAFLEGYSDTLVRATKSAWGSDTGTVDTWVPVGTNGMFRGTAGQPCWVVIQLQIQHWSCNGGVWVDIDDFWYPSVDPDRDIVITD